MEIRRAACRSATTLKEPICLKLELEINRQRVDAEFTASNGTAHLAIDGKNRQAQISEPEPGLFTILLDNRVYRCLLERTPAGATEVVVNGKRIAVAVVDKKRLRGGAGDNAAAGGRTVLTAPMPGKVVRILRHVQEEVAEDQGVMIVEAMKMQNEVQAPRKGKVLEIKVTEGQTVNAGEVLAVIE